MFGAKAHRTGRADAGVDYAARVGIGGEPARVENGYLAVRQRSSKVIQFAFASLRE